MTVGIVHYGMGNLCSVRNALESLNCPTVIMNSPAELANVTHIILPGVGAFGDGMANLRRGGWISALQDAVVSGGKPFLGICLGMQLLATMGTEHGEHPGLGWIPGTVPRLIPTDPSLRIPHIGWNDVEIVRPNGLYAGAQSVPSYYFVHSYAFQPADASVISGYCTHGARFAASVEQGNIWATQYHPEKSQKHGLAVLRNFLKL